VILNCISTSDVSLIFIFSNFKAVNFGFSLLSLQINDSNCNASNVTIVTMLIVLVSFVSMLFKFSNILYFFSAIHGSAADALADVSGVEGGERAVAGGAAGDVDGPQRDAG
jgi:hypothetical protein